jgi:hypothetical protein
MSFRVDESYKMRKRKSTCNLLQMTIYNHMLSYVLSALRDCYGTQLQNLVMNRHAWSNEVL